MTKRDLHIGQAILHYRRMIEWAKKKNPKGETSFVGMYRSIKENWSAEHCPLCKNYVCANCPLALVYGPCDDGNAWGGFETSYKWAQWIVTAEKVLSQLESLKDFVIKPQEGPAMSKLTNSEDEVLYLYESGDWTLREIAKDYEVGVSTLKRWLKKHRKK